MTARFHLSVLTAPPAAPTALPGFITDIRPRPRLREPGQATRAAQLTGLDGVYVPFAADGLESLVVAGGLLRGSSTVQVTAEFHPAIASPVYAAKLAASLQRYSASRLAWRLLIDLDQATARAQGDFLPERDRYARAAEFLTVAKGVWSTAPYTYEGRFYEVLGGGFPRSRSNPRFPAVYLSGTSPEALALSAAHADVHLFGPGEDLRLLPNGVKAGLVLPVLAREDDEEAALAGKRSGVDALAGAVIGSYERVAGRLAEYAARGVSEFVLQPPDPVADGYLLGQHVLPLLRAGHQPQGDQRPQAGHQLQADRQPQADRDDATEAVHVG
jgi:alkanesulfonate monooxygenase